jgi:ribosomal protein S27AE
MSSTTGPQVKRPPLDPPVGNMRKGERLTNDETIRQCPTCGDSFLAQGNQRKCSPCTRPLLRGQWK